MAPTHPRSCPRRLGFHGLLVLVLLALLGTGAAEARTRTFCKTWYYGGKSRACGKHLQPGCASGRACDAGYSTYSGSPFPIPIDCPSPIPDEKVKVGCYDSSQIPDCTACGGQGEVPCPSAASNFCTVGCEPGLSPNPTTTLCEAPGTAGTPCGGGYGCGPGLVCDFASLPPTCKGFAQAKESCLSPWVSCAAGLSCTGAFECSHTPAKLGETCDIGNHCEAGLFCKAGLPQRCHRFSTLGEGCSAFQPCASGLQCEPCLTGSCNAPLQCVFNESQGRISTQQCKNLYSASVHQEAVNAGEARTRGIAKEEVALLGTSEEFGVVYGSDGRYGCFESVCGGVAFDVAEEAAATFGSYASFDAVAGGSFVKFREGQVPGSLLNVSVGEVFPRSPGQILPNSPKIGDSLAVSFGVGLSPAPFAAGLYACDTTVDLVVPDSPLLGSGGGAPPPPGPQPQPYAPPGGVGALRFDGVDDALAVTDPAALAALRMTGAFTMEAWIRPATPGQSAMFLNKEGEYELGLSAGELVWAIAYPGGWVSNKTGAFPSAGSWTHVAVRYDGQAVYTTVNGQPAHWKEASGAVGDVHTNADQLRIGGRQLFADAFEGDIDGVRIWSRALTPAEIRLGLDAPPQGPGLVAGWDFAEETGGALEDLGPGGFDIALSALGTTRAPLRTDGDRTTQGGALLFDGVDDHVAVTEPSALDQLEMLATLTVEAWVYPTGSSSGGGTIVSKEGEYALGRAADGSITWSLAGASPGWTRVTTTAIAPQDVWSHVALVYDGLAGTARVYVNGVLADTQPASGVLGDAFPDEAELRIGGRQRDDLGTSPAEPFQGLIDEVRIWGTARSAAQIAASFDRAVRPDAAGLFGYWRFDEAATDVVFDSSGALHHGVLGSGRPGQVPARTTAAAFYGYPFSAAAPTLDGDGDGIADDRDSCVAVRNPEQQDADGDRFGDACDCDLDNDGGCGIADFNGFLADFVAGTDSGQGTDMDGDGSVGIADFNLFLSGFQTGVPGPSGLVP